MPHLAVSDNYHRLRMLVITNFVPERKEQHHERQEQHCDRLPHHGLNGPPMRCWLAALVLMASTASAAEKLVVAVLYFDNNTGNREYDVLQKGLADMLITDLSGVERGCSRRRGAIR